jgi:DNA-directed RNA polymerase subunit RPC12/RpoP
VDIVNLRGYIIFSPYNVFMAVMGEEAYKCPKCGSQNSFWRGYRCNESGKKRLRKGFI